MKLSFLILLVPVLSFGMGGGNSYFLLDERVYDAAYYTAREKFDKLKLIRRSEIESEFSRTSELDFERNIIRLLYEGKLNVVIKLTNEKSEDCSYFFNQCTGRLLSTRDAYNNPIEACLIAMQAAKNIEVLAMGKYRVAESAMLMAYVLNNIPNTAHITKSQVHRAWPLNPHVSHMMALCRKHPENADEIIATHMQTFRELFTRKLAR